MTWTTAASAATVVGPILLVAGFLGSYIRAAGAAKAAEQAARLSQYKQGVADGRSARDDEVALLRSQRDDARRERDNAQRRADQLEADYRRIRDTRDGT